MKKIGGNYNIIIDDSAVSESDIVSFIMEVDSEKSIQNWEQRMYRDSIVKHFDGEVCNRIYKYFDV